MEYSFADQVKNLLYSVSPNRKREIDDLVRGVTFEEDGKGEHIGCFAFANWKYVRITTRCQFRLWAHCLAYFAAFAEFGAKWQGTCTQSCHGLSGYELTAASKLLTWAVSADVSLRKARREGTDFAVPELPANVPLPFPSQSVSILEKCAKDMFVYAMASTIHHELAHVQIGHGNATGEKSVEEEEAADLASVDWVLGGTIATEYEYLVRHLGVAVKFIWYSTLFLHEKYGDDSHPPPWRRLLYCLAPSVRGDADPVWGFVVIALSLHFHNLALPIDQFTEFAPTKTTVCEMIEFIEKFNERVADT